MLGYKTVYSYGSSISPQLGDVLANKGMVFRSKGGRKEGRIHLEMVEKENQKTKAMSIKSLFQTLFFPLHITYPPSPQAMPQRKIKPSTNVTSLHLPQPYHQSWKRPTHPTQQPANYFIHNHWVNFHFHRWKSTPSQSSGQSCYPFSPNR